MCFLFKLTHTFLESVCSIKPQGRDSNPEETRQLDTLWYHHVPIYSVALTAGTVPASLLSGVSWIFLLPSLLSKLLLLS